MISNQVSLQILFKEQSAKLPSCSVLQLFPCLGVPALVTIRFWPSGCQTKREAAMVPMPGKAMQGPSMSLPMWLFPAAPWSKYFEFKNKNKKEGLTETCSPQAAAWDVGVTSTGVMLCSGPKSCCGHAQGELGQTHLLTSYLLT